MIPVFIDYCWISTVEIAFMLPPRGYPRSFNRYYINRHHTMYSYACKKFDPAGAFPFANAPAGPYRWNVSIGTFLHVRPLIRNRPMIIRLESYRFEVLHFWKCLLLSFRYPDLRHPIFFILFCSYELLCYRYHEMQLRILTRQGGVNACALARWTHSAFRPTIFCFLLEIPIHFIFHLHPKYTKSQSRKIPTPGNRSGDSAFCERGSLRSIY